MLTKLLTFLFGQAELLVEEKYRNKFLGIISEGKIKAHISQFDENGSVLVKMSPKDVKKIAPALDKNGIIVYINNVRSIIAYLSKQRKRIGLLVGGLLFFSLLFASTLFVFKIEIHGSDLLSRKQAEEELAELGICVGARISHIDKTDVAGRFLQNHPEFSYAAVNFKGTTISLELRERENADSQKEQKADILVAKSDGEIVNLLVYSGKAAVSPGTVVKKGDLLINGYVSGNGLQYTDTPHLRFDGASGVVLARVREKLCVTVEFEEKIITKERGKRVGVRLTILGFDISIGNVSDAENNGVTASEERFLTVMGAIELPITCVEYYTEQTSETVIYRDEAQATAIAQIRVYEMLLKSARDASITDFNVDTQVSEDGVSVIIDYGCVRDIAAPRNIQTEKGEENGGKESGN